MGSTRTPSLLMMMTPTGFTPPPPPEPSPSCLSPVLPLAYATTSAKTEAKAQEGHKMV